MKKKILIIMLLLWSNIALTEDNSNKILKYSLIQHDEPIVVKEIKFYDLEGNPHTLDEYTGQPVILQFWATWCTFCINNIKELDDLYKNFKNEKKDHKVHIITLSEDYKDPTIVKSFFTQKKIELLTPYTDKGNVIFNNLMITSIPSTILLDSNGKEVVRINGFINWTKDKDFLAILAKYQQN